jgi:hypothetical protein
LTTFGAQNSEEQIIGGFDEDRNAYIGNRALDCGDLRPDQANWAGAARGAAHHSHSLRPFGIEIEYVTSNLFCAFWAAGLGWPQGMHNWFYVFIDWLALPSLALLAGVLIYRNQQRQFPFFSLYVIVTELVGLTRLAASGAPARVYSHVYWISDIAVVLFALLAAYELFVKRLFPGFYRVRFFRYLFPMFAILVNIMVILIAIYGNHKRLLLLTARTAEFLRSAILVFFVALMVLMGRQWEKREFGIAAGFGLDVSTSLAAIAIWSHIPGSSAVLSRLPVFAYDLACFIWLYSFWNAPKTQNTVPPVPLSADALHEAKKWEDSLKNFTSQGKR